VRRPRLRIFALLPAIAALGCTKPTDAPIVIPVASTSAPSIPVAAPLAGPTARVPQGPEACGAEHVWVQGNCIDLAGSSWEFTTHMPEGTRVFAVDFHPGGKATSHDPADSTPDDDEWSTEGDTVHFWFNRRYVEHVAKLERPMEMQGKALNVVKTTWTWSARRVR
jgi:hypothetical protein